MRKWSATKLVRCPQTSIANVSFLRWLHGVPDQPKGVDRLAFELLQGVRGATARAITLVESTRPDHRQLALQLLSQLHSKRSSCPSFRIGISGPPGVGKSTFIEKLGIQLLDEKHKVAVLAVDPSSARTGGSVLGDKTRMPELSRSANAYVRPSPTRGTLGNNIRDSNESLSFYRWCDSANK